jgi:hypothetical protein
MLSTIIILSFKKKTLKNEKDFIKRNSVIEINDKRYKRIQNNIKPITNHKYKISEKKEKMNENEWDIKSNIINKRNSAKLMQTGKSIVSLNSPIKKATSSTNAYITPSVTSFNLNI